LLGFGRVLRFLGGRWDGGERCSGRLGRGIVKQTGRMRLWDSEN